MCLGAAIQNRLGWEQVPLSPSDERQEFDSMCREWARFQMDPVGFHQAPSAVFPGNESTAVLSSSDDDHTGSLHSYWDGTDSSGSRPQSSNSSPHPHQDHAHHPHAHARERTRPSVIVTESAPRSSDGDSRGGMTSIHSGQDRHRQNRSKSVDTDEPDLVPPSERQCRTLRVMVAWKA